MKYFIGFSLGLIIFLYAMFLGYVIRDKNIVISKSSAPVQLDSFKIYNLVNDYKAKNNLEKLSWNPKLCNFANIRIRQISSNFSHEGYDPQYKNFYNSSFTGENLVKGSYSEKDALNSWLNSPEHLSNIINPHYTQTCVATNLIGTETYVVQEFASDF